MSNPRSSSGLTAVRQLVDQIIIPPNTGTFVVGDTRYETSPRDATGYSHVRAGVCNDTAGEIRILQAWIFNKNYVLVSGVTTTLDPETGLYVVDVDTPITRRYIKIVFVPNTSIGANFEIGAYLIPRT